MSQGRIVWRIVHNPYLPLSGLFFTKQTPQISTCIRSCEGLSNLSRKQLCANSDRKRIGLERTQSLSTFELRIVFEHCFWRTLEGILKEQERNLEGVSKELEDYGLTSEALYQYLYLEYSNLYLINVESSS